MDGQEIIADIRERLVRVETKQDIILMQCPECRTKISNLEVATTEAKASASSAHKRIDSQDKKAAAIAGGISFFIAVVQFVINYGGK